MQTFTRARTWVKRALPIIDRNVTIEGNKCSLNALGRTVTFGEARISDAEEHQAAQWHGRFEPGGSTGWPPSMTATSTDGACGGAVLTFGPLTLENSIITESKSVNRQKRVAVQLYCWT